MQDLPEDICRRFRGSIQDGVSALGDLVSSGTGSLPTNFIQKTFAAIQTNDWSAVARAFVNCEFIGTDGKFLFIAPYSSRKCGIISTILTGVYGKIIPSAPAPDCSALISEYFGQTPEVSRAIPFHCFSSFGHAYGKEADAFLVPDGWAFPDSERGPVLNNMTAQQYRFDRIGKNCLAAIFSPASMELLTSALLDPTAAAVIRHREVEFHEAAHATGLGLRQKVQVGLLRSAWDGAVEEWRADGVEFEFLARTCNTRDAGEAIAANYCLRFGFDAHRPGGIAAEMDVIATLLTFDSLLKHEALFIDENRRLSFKEASFGGLLRASLYHREQALQFTCEEVARRFEDGASKVRASLLVDQPTKILFEGLVRGPCRSLFPAMP